MMYFLPDNVKTEALLKSGQQLIQDPSKWCKGAMQKGDSFCINGALFAGYGLFMIWQSRKALKNLR